MSDGGEAALVELIYEAALSPKLWQSVFDETCRLLGLHAVGAMHSRVEAGRPPAFSLMGLSGVPGAVFADYRDNYASRDTNLVYARRQPVGTIYGEPLGFSRESMRRSEIFNDFLRPNGADCPMVAVLGKDGPEVTDLLAYTPLGQQFTAEQVGALRRLVPHLCRSIRIETELKRAAVKAAVGASAINQVGRPLFVVDRGGFVHGCNNLVMALLDAHPTVLGLTADGRLAVRRPDGQRRLSGAIEQALLAADGAAPPPIFQVAAEGAAISVMVAPASSQLDGHSGGRLVSVLMNVVDAPFAPTPARLQQEFGFTPAEALVVADLAAGLSVEEVAEKRGLKRDTVYVHVKHAREKTGTISQAQLVAMVWRGLAAFCGR